jgi:predicted aspartyl protease
VTLPFLSFHGHTVIRMEIQGLTTNALLDTGAESTVLDLSILEEVPALESHPVQGYGVTLQGLTGELLDARVVQDVQLMLAGQNFRVTDMFAANLRRMTNFYGPEIHAVLGMRQLRNFDMTFDYRRHQVTFQRVLR